MALFTFWVKIIDDEHKNKLIHKFEFRGMFHTSRFYMRVLN